MLFGGEVRLSSDRRHGQSEESNDSTQHIHGREVGWGSGEVLE